MKCLPLASLLCILGLAALGCAHDQSATDEHWGESYRELSQRQIADPEAGQDGEPVMGLGSTSANHVSSEYGERRSSSNQNSRVETSTLDQLGD